MAKHQQLSFRSCTLFFSFGWWWWWWWRWWRRWRWWWWWWRWRWRWRWWRWRWRWWWWWWWRWWWWRWYRILTCAPFAPTPNWHHCTITGTTYILLAGPEARMLPCALLLTTHKSRRGSWMFMWSFPFWTGCRCARCANLITITGWCRIDT